jgi:Imm-5 like putative immunity protein
MNLLKRLFGGGKAQSAPNQTERQAVTTKAETLEKAGREYSAWAEKNSVRSATEAWAKLQRPDWMLWLANDKGVKLAESNLRLFACDCAETVLCFFEQKHPEDKRPRHAVEMSRRFAKGEATKDALAVAATGGLAAADAAKAAADFAAKSYEAAAAADRVAEAAYSAAFSAAEEAVLRGPSPNATALLTRIKTLDAAANAASTNAQVALAALKAEAAACGAAIAAMSAARGDAMSAAQAASEAAAASNSTSVAPNIEQADRLRIYFPNPFEVDRERNSGTNKHAR